MWTKIYHQKTFICIAIETKDRWNHWTWRYNSKICSVSLYLLYIGFCPTYYILFSKLIQGGNIIPSDHTYIKIFNYGAVFQLKNNYLIQQCNRINNTNSPSNLITCLWIQIIFIVYRNTRTSKSHASLCCYSGYIIASIRWKCTSAAHLSANNINSLCMLIKNGFRISKNKLPKATFFIHGCVVMLPFCFHYGRILQFRALYRWRGIPINPKFERIRSLMGFHEFLALTSLTRGSNEEYHHSYADSIILWINHLIAVGKDSCVVYACGFDRNEKWEWFCESKWHCKNDAAKMMLQNDVAGLTTRWQAEQTALFLQINL